MRLKAVVPVGAPFRIVLPISVVNGSLANDATSLTIPKGSVESAPVTVSRTDGTFGAVSVDIGTLPGLPPPPAFGFSHHGYALVKSGELPLTVIDAHFAAVSKRTAAVQRSIVAAVPGVNNADDVTVDHLVAITRLDLSEQVITTLAARDFDDLTGLQSLRLNDNELTALPVGLFDGLMSLNAVYLQNNALTAVDADLFDGLTTLRYINLSDNELTLFPEDLFDGLTALRELYLGENTVSSFPEDLFEGLTGLWALGLNNMGLSSLPPDLFDGLTGLGELYLRHNNLSSLPEDLFEGLTELRDIYLRYNSLTELPPDVFDGLTGLNSLYLNHNDLTTLSADIFDGLTTLRTLHLSHNELTELPDGLFDGLSLTSLLLRNNAVELSVPVSLESTGSGEFKAIAPVGAPSVIVVPITIRNGSLPNGVTSVTISPGRVESSTVTVSRTEGDRGSCYCRYRCFTNPTSRS